MAGVERTRVAVLGTLAEFHREPIPFDLPALVDLVSQINPDLLCLDMTPTEWQSRDFDALPPEYRQALLPLAHQTDIVVVPIAGGHPQPRAEAVGWRGAPISWLRKLLAILQRTAPGPDAINHGWRHELANLLYHATRILAGSQVGQAQRAHTDWLTKQVLAVAQRDPGTRVLVVVNVQYCHIIRHRLRQAHHLKVEVTSYANL